MDRRKLQQRIRTLLQQMSRTKGPHQEKKKCRWARDIFKNRKCQGAFEALFHEMPNNEELIFRYFRMSPERFDHLITLVREQIEEKDTAFRKPFPAACGLAITLRYLASGETQQSLSYSYSIGRSTVSTVIVKTCKAIYTAFKDHYLKSPSIEDARKAIAAKFEVSNFAHILGVIDGKHIRIECPKLTGTLYHNYKGFFSMVFLAVCDIDNCFTLFGFGSNGSNNDCGMLLNSLMGEKLERQTPLTILKTSL